MFGEDVVHYFVSQLGKDVMRLEFRLDADDSGEHVKDLEAKLSISCHCI